MLIKSEEVLTVSCLEGINEAYLQHRFNETRQTANVSYKTYIHRAEYFNAKTVSEFKCGVCGQKIVLYHTGKLGAIIKLALIPFMSYVLSIIGLLFCFPAKDYNGYYVFTIFFIIASSILHYLTFCMHAYFFEFFLCIGHTKDDYIQIMDIIVYKHKIERAEKKFDKKFLFLYIFQGIFIISFVYILFMTIFGSFGKGFLYLLMFCGLFLLGIVGTSIMNALFFSSEKDTTKVV